MVSAHRRRGFTLIELLVVIAIIAILIGLLLPAVQKVREAAARLKCQNNVKQLALACHTYADVMGGLPPALITPGGTNAVEPNNTTGYGPNWIVLLLPYIEQGALYNQRSASITSWMQNANTNHDWRNVRGVVIPSLICPSDGATGTPYSGAGGNWARGNYAANMGPGAVGNRDGRVANMTPSGGTAISSRGPFWQTTRLPHQCMTIQGMPDGSSNTVMLGEVRAGLTAGDPRGVWALGHVGSSSVTAFAQGDCILINNRNSGADDVRGCSNDHARGMGCCTGCASNQAVFRSQHTGGVNAAMGDGSVRFLRDATNAQILAQITSATDGRPTPDF